MCFNALLIEGEIILNVSLIFLQVNSYLCVLFRYSVSQRFDFQLWNWYDLHASIQIFLKHLYWLMCLLPGLSRLIESSSFDSQLFKMTKTPRMIFILSKYSTVKPILTETCVIGNNLKKTRYHSNVSWKYFFTKLNVIYVSSYVMCCKPITRIN